MNPRPKAPGTKPEGAESSNPRQASSGSGEERTWTIYEAADGFRAFGSNLESRQERVEVVEASALRAEREARESLEATLQRVAKVEAKLLRSGRPHDLSVARALKAALDGEYEIRLHQIWKEGS